MPARKKQRTDVIVFRPDSRDGSKDYLIPKDIGRKLYMEGKISWDATNGGYCPRPGVHCVVYVHRVVGMVPMWWHNRQ